MTTLFTIFMGFPILGWAFGFMERHFLEQCIKMILVAVVAGAVMANMPGVFPSWGESFGWPEVFLLLLGVIEGVTVATVSAKVYDLRARRRAEAKIARGGAEADED